MAKSQEALLSEVVGQLRKLNQLTVRDRLREAEEAKRAELLTDTGEVQTDQQSTIIDAGQDFQRRFIAGQAKTLIDSKITKTGAKGQRITMIDAIEKMHHGLAAAIGDLAGIMMNSWEFDKVTTANKIRSDRELRLESRNNLRRNASMVSKDGKKLAKGPGKSSATAIADEMQDEADETTTDGFTIKKGLLTLGIAAAMKKIFSKAIFKPFKALGRLALRLGPIAWIISSIGFSIADFVEGMKEDGIAGALAKIFGGDGEGGWKNAIGTGLKLAGLGMGIGLLFGGPAGMIAGGIIGGAIGLIGGFVGSDAIKQDFKAFGAMIAKKWKDARIALFNFSRSIGLWFYTPETTGQMAGPHGTVHSARFFGGLITTDGLKEVGAAIVQKWHNAVDAIKGFARGIGNWFISGGEETSHHGTRSNIQLFGGFIEWDPNKSIGTKISEKWSAAIGYIAEKIKAIGGWFYTKDGEEIKLFGGSLTIPDWSALKTELGQKWNNMWETITSIPSKIVDWVISLFPDWVQDKIRDEDVAKDIIPHASGFSDKNAVKQKAALLASIAAGMEMEAGGSSGLVTTVTNSGNSQVVHIHHSSENVIFGIAGQFPGGYEIPWYLRK